MSGVSGEFFVLFLKGNALFCDIIKMEGGSLERLSRYVGRYFKKDILSGFSGI